MRRPRFVAVVVMAGCLAACAAPATNPGGTAAASVAPAPPKPSFTQEGLASWYGRGWNGRKTASGEKFDMHAMTAAHRSLPLGTVVRVTNLENGRSAKVRINDRGPNVADDPRRILDLSAHAATRLGMIEDGVTRVKVEALDADQEADNSDQTSD
jgi:rare lipoprotein A